MQTRSFCLETLLGGGRAWLEDVEEWLSSTHARTYNPSREFQLNQPVSWLMIGTTNSQDHGTMCDRETPFGPRKAAEDWLWSDVKGLQVLPREGPRQQGKS